MSTLSQPFSLLQWCRTRQAWGWAVLVLCLGLLGGCGGGGGGSATNAAPTPLSLDLQPSAGLTTTITAGTTLVLVPTYPSSVSSAVLKWNDGTAKSTAVSASGAPVTIGSSLASSAIPYVFTLEVTYQDPTVLRPSLLTQTQTLSVTVNPAPAAKLLTTGSLITGRSDFTATMLTNGTLLVAGGVSSTGTVLKSAEIYDPVTGKWTATGEMKSARRGHAASLLPDGRVLVSGGFDGTTAVTALNKADIYDPATGIWSATGTLIQARRGHTSTLLNNKKVLIVGGIVSSGSGNVAELFDADPASNTFGTFIATGSNLLARQGHTATLLWDGRVLIAGRSNADGVTLCANASEAPVACSDASYSKNIDSGRTTEVFTPSATTPFGSWSYGPTLAHARYNHTSTTMGTAQRLLILGGFGSGASTGEVIVPDALATTTASLARISVTGLNLVKPVAYHNTLYLPASSDNTSPFQFLVVGGYNLGDGSLSILQRFTITESSGAFSSNSTSTNSLQLNTPRAMHSSTRLNNGSVVILGNYYTSTGTVTGTVEIWSP